MPLDLTRCVQLLLPSQLGCFGLPKFAGSQPLYFWGGTERVCVDDGLAVTHDHSMVLGPFLPGRCHQMRAGCCQAEAVRCCIENLKDHDDM